jgi:hypothetical protein
VLVTNFNYLYINRLLVVTFSYGVIGKQFRSWVYNFFRGSRYPKCHYEQSSFCTFVPPTSSIHYADKTRCQTVQAQERIPVVAAGGQQRPVTADAVDGAVLSLSADFVPIVFLCRAPAYNSVGFKC